MPSCPICLDALKSPAALPCGHVCCHDCILRSVKAIKPHTSHRRCPVCCKPYILVEGVDPELLPDSQQLHESPSISTQRLNLSAPNDASTEACARYKAEITSLRAQCKILHWRSGVSSATIAGLTCLAKMTRDRAIQLKHERDAFEQKYNDLKRQVTGENEHTAYSPSSSTSVDCADPDRSSLRAASSSPAQHVGSLGRHSTDSERLSPAKRVKREETPVPLPRSPSYTSSRCRRKTNRRNA